MLVSAVVPLSVMVLIEVVKVDDSGSEWLKVSESGGENGLK